LNQLLDVCYHASFLVEESRPVTFRAVFLEHTTPIKPLEADPSHPTELYLFDAPVPFTAEEVRQVAPAADLTNVLIAIQCIDAGSGAVHLGSEEALFATEAELEDTVLADGVALPVRARVRVRYRDRGTPARVAGTGRGAAVRFEAPVRALTPGQLAVFYEGDCVIGGGRIGRSCTGSGGPIP